MANANKPEPSGDTWAEYRRLILAELERLDMSISRLAETNLEHEKELIEVVSTCKTELIERLQKLKDILEDRYRELIEAVKKELETKEQNDISALKAQTKELENNYHKVSAEVKVIKAKAALFGFLSGLVIAIISLVVKIMWNK